MERRGKFTHSLSQSRKGPSGCCLRCTLQQHAATRSTCSGCKLQARRGVRPGQGGRHVAGRIGGELSATIAVHFYPRFLLRPHQTHHLSRREEKKKRERPSSEIARFVGWPLPIGFAGVLLSGLSACLPLVPGQQRRRPANRQRRRDALARGIHPYPLFSLSPKRRTPRPKQAKGRRVRQTKM